jgi:diacylglycerol kinase family enzyme
VSSHSGAGLAATAYHNILAPLLNLFSLNATLHETSSKTSHREFLSTTPFSTDHENIIVPLGGDTIIYGIINALSENPTLTPTHRVTISPIPCGTGNALPISLGTKSIPIGISKFFGISESGAVETRPLPLLKITLRGRAERVFWGVVVCSWGLHASLVADSDAPEMRKEFGAKRFVV